MQASNFEQELEAKIANAVSEEEVLTIFAEAGISVTAEQLNADMESTDGELSEDALDNVAGGSIWYIAKKIWNRYKANRYSGGGRGFSSGGGGGHSFGGGGGGGR